MDADQAEQLRQQKEMQRLEARVREAAARQAMPGGAPAAVEGVGERRMRELYEERLREYGDLATVEDEQGEEERCVGGGVCCWLKFHPGGGSRWRFGRQRSNIYSFTNSLTTLITRPSRNVVDIEVISAIIAGINKTTARTLVMNRIMSIDEKVILPGT